MQKRTFSAKITRWCFLYDSQKQAAFLDSHVNFFDLVGGVWQEVFYDNMRNVVSSEKKATVIEKLKAFFDKYFGLM